MAVNERGRLYTRDDVFRLFDFHSSQNSTGSELTEPPLTGDVAILTGLTDEETENKEARSLEEIGNIDNTSITILPLASSEDDQAIHPSPEEYSETRPDDTVSIITTTIVVPEDFCETLPVAIDDLSVLVPAANDDGTAPLVPNKDVASTTIDYQQNYLANQLHDGFNPVGTAVSYQQRAVEFQEESSPPLFTDDSYDPLDQTYQPIDTSGSSSNDEDNIDVIPPAQQAAGKPSETESQPLHSCTKKRKTKTERKDTVRKKHRLEGVEHVNTSGKIKNKVKLGPACESSACAKSKLRDCTSISSDVRQKVFDSLWKLASWESRRLFVTTSVKTVDIKQKKVPAPNSRRSTSFTYHLILPDGTTKQVCKAMYCSTLGINPCTVGLWLSGRKTLQVDNNTEEPNRERKSKAPKSGLTAKTSDDDINFLVPWLNSLPTVDSHYCRNVPSYKLKKFLYPGTRLVDLFEAYQKDALKQNKRMLGLSLFRNHFFSNGFSVFIPKKDQCNFCITFKHGGRSQEEQDKHITEKNQAREAKAFDKEDENPSHSVWTADLQAVLLCPKTNANAMYYKTKLQVHNLTLYDLKNKSGHCYLWDESEGDLRSDMFACIFYKHFKKVITDSPHLSTITIWSDGCGYQNRCTAVSNMYHHLSLETNIKIFQKYLVSGHTQMECDSVHSTIERHVSKTDVYTPHEYALLMKTACRKNPYQVQVLEHSEIFALPQNAYFSSIRPGKKAGDPTVSDIKALCYEDGKVSFKLSHSDTVYTQLPQRIAKNPIQWKPLFSGRRKIKARKFADLMELKSVMPPHTHHYFDSLPHE